MMKTPLLALIFLFILSALIACSGSSNAQDMSMNVGFTELARGSDATGNYISDKRIIVIREEDDFIERWLEATTDPIPQVDFGKNIVIANLQGETDIGTCRTHSRFEGISTSRSDNDVVSVVLNYDLICQDEGEVCPDVLETAHPYSFYIIQTNTQFLRLQENFTTINCGNG